MSTIVDPVARAKYLRNLVRAGGVGRKAWVDTKHRPCLLAAYSSDVLATRSPSACPADMMWPWLASATIWMDDCGSEEAWPAMVRRYADVVLALSKAGAWRNKALSEQVRFAIASRLMEEMVRPYVHDDDAGLYDRAMAQDQTAMAALVKRRDDCFAYAESMDFGLDRRPYYELKRRTAALSAVIAYARGRLVDNFETILAIRINAAFAGGKPFEQEPLYDKRIAIYLNELERADVLTIEFEKLEPGKYTILWYGAEIGVVERHPGLWVATAAEDLTLKIPRPTRRHAAGDLVRALRRRHA